MRCIANFGWLASARGSADVLRYLNKATSFPDHVEHNCSFFGRVGESTVTLDVRDGRKNIFAWQAPRKATIALPEIGPEYEALILASFAVISSKARHTKEWYFLCEDTRSQSRLWS